MHDHTQKKTGGFFSRLAWTNIRTNAQTLIPYLISCILSITLFYTLVSLAGNNSLQQISGGQTLKIILNFGIVIIAVFSVIFLFYTNSFLIKRRKQSFGLYMILGMEKKHLARMLGLETLMTSVFSLAAGLACSLLFNKLLFLVLLRIIHYDIQLGFEISPMALGLTAALFAGIFCLNLLYTLAAIAFTKPTDLLHGGQIGEREPKARVFLAILGFVCLAAGYAISLTVERPLDALTLFFVAVLLVIIGTYCLFTAGSIVILKGLRRRKGYYYQTNHFISVSGMLYRMKQNAVGLANIAILSTMVLVVLSTTIALYTGVNEIMTFLFPTDLSLSYYSGAPYADRAATDADIQRIVDGQGLSLSGKRNYDSLVFGMAREGDTYTPHTGNRQYNQASEICMVQAVTAADYAAMTGTDTHLLGNAILAYGNRYAVGDTLTIFGTQYIVAGHLDSFPLMEATYNAYYGVDTTCLVVSDQAHLMDLYARQLMAYGDQASPMVYTVDFNLDGSDAAKLACFNALNAPGVLNAEAVSDGLPVISSGQMGIPGAAATWDVRSLQDSYRNFYYAYGGILFIGLLLGISFAMATVLIIYYKQLNEGYDDRKRFEIMQNVGLSHEEVRRAIHGQILTVFFLPLIVAAVHVTFAFPVITKLLSLFSLHDTPHFILCTLAVFAAFALLYTGVYLRTARTYYNIVRR